MTWEGTAPRGERTPGLGVRRRPNGAQALIAAAWLVSSDAANGGALPGRLATPTNGTVTLQPFNFVAPFDVHALTAPAP